MRRFALLAPLVLLAACGGATDPPVPPPPPPGPVPVATTVAVQAGDGQSAEAGSTVTVAPSVIVKDQLNRAMAGVSVTFSVDSGGGAVSTGSASTAGDGVASSGGWTLGLGRNRLKAVAGSLPPVFFTGTGTELTVLDATLGIGGGAIVVNRPGDPLDGMKLELPANAYTQGIRVRVRRGDSTGAPRKAGMRLASPVLTITSDAPGYTAKGAFVLRIPAAVPATEWPVVVVFDRTTGAIDVLPGSRTATGVVAITRHLNAAYLPPTSGAQQRLRASQLRIDDVAISMAVYGLPLSVLNGDLDSGYRPNVDDWEFDFWPAGHLAESGYSEGLAFASAWYYSVYKNQGSLNGKYQQAKGVQGSNWRGIRLGSIAYQMADYTEQRDFHTAIYAQVSQLSPDSLDLLNVKAGIHVTGRPQVIIAFDPLSANPVASPWISMLAYRSRGSGLDVTLGTNATGVSPPTTLTLTNGIWGSISWRLRNGYTDRVFGPYTYQGFRVLGMTAGIPLHQIDPMFDAFFDGTIGDGVFPETELVSTEERGIGDTLFVRDDTTRVWLECTTICPWGYPAGPKIQPVGKVASGQIFIKSGANWGGGTTFMFGQGLPVTDQDEGKRIGLVITAPDDPQLTKPLFINWKEYVIKTKRLTISPAPLNGATATDYNLTVAYGRPLPANPSWVWDLGDGRQIITTTPALAVKYTLSPATAADTFDIKVTLKGGTTIEATGHSAAIIRNPVPVWKFTSMTLQFTQTGPNLSGQAGWRVDSTRYSRIRAGLTQGAIYLVAQPFTRTCTGCRELTLAEGLYLLEGGSLTLATLAAPPRIFELGVTPAIEAFPTPPRVNGWHIVQTIPTPGPFPQCRKPDEQFQRTGDLTNGRITGLLHVFCGQLGDVQRNEADVTIAGDTATGTLIGTYSRDHGVVGIDVYTLRVTFQATRVVQ